MVITSVKSVFKGFNGPTTLKDMKLHFHQATGQATKLLIQCNWSGPRPLCSCLIGLKSTVMLITVLDSLTAA